MNAMYGSMTQIGSKWRKLAGALVVIAMLCGCTKSDSSDSGVTGGTVGGLVFDGTTEQPLAGASVDLISASKTSSTITGADGAFTISAVPLGDFILRISNAGYQTAIVNDTFSRFNDSTLAQNTTVGPFGLIRNGGSFAIKIVDEAGNPVSGVNVVARPQIRFIDYSSGGPSAQGSYEVTGTSGADGVVTLSGLPNYAALGTIAASVDLLPVDVPPIQVTGSPVYSFLGGTFSFPVAHLGQLGITVDEPMIRLAGPDSDLVIFDSNVDVLRGQAAGSVPVFTRPVAGFVPNGPITISFNQSVNPSTIRATLFNEDGTLAPIQMTATVATNLVTLTPTAQLTAATRYNMALHVDRADQTGGQTSRREINLTAPLFAAPVGGATLQIVAGSPKRSADGFSFTFQFSEPVGIGFGSSAGVSCVAYYEGINLDGTPSLSPGEWNNGVGETCPNPALDLTAIAPLENAVANMPVTGFSSRWRITFDDAGNGACSPGVTKATGCVVPTSGTLVHFIFDKIASGTIKRPDGTPILGVGSLTVAIPAP
jgi:carboxypeptidase family protein/Big-like domain-containing protein